MDGSIEGVVWMDVDVDVDMDRQTPSQAKPSSTARGEFSGTGGEKKNERTNGTERCEIREAIEPHRTESNHIERREARYAICDEMLSMATEAHRNEFARLESNLLESNRIESGKDTRQRETRETNKLHPASHWVPLLFPFHSSSFVCAPKGPLRSVPSWSIPYHTVRNQTKPNDAIAELFGCKQDRTYPSSSDSCTVLVSNHCSTEPRVSPSNTHTHTHTHPPIYAYYMHSHMHMHIHLSIQSNPSREIRPILF
mmetsp:Transcript_24825/g.54501  ORF Transcript_24825/g.54501 Transcript_24825/m.54501 type:complete len:254 (-) Transcript_24825:3729-4490(-)